MTIAPIVCTIQTKARPERAFGLFTQRMAEWWTGKTIAPNRAVAIIVEPHPEGRWFERDADGKETQWGRVLVWEPPARLVLAWQLDAQFTYDPAFLTEVEISFTPMPSGGTRVRLEHRHLERFGGEAARIAGLIGQGWPQKLAGFEAFAAEHTAPAHN